MIFNFYFEAKYFYLELVLYPTGTVHVEILFLCIKSLPFLLFIAVVID